MPYHTIRYFGDKKYVVNVCDQTGEVYHKDHIGYVSVYSENANKWFGSYNDLYEFKYGKKNSGKKNKKTNRRHYQNKKNYDNRRYENKNEVVNPDENNNSETKE
jgi:ribosomal protein L35